MAHASSDSIGPLGKLIGVVLIFVASFLITGSVMGFDLAFQSLGWFFGGLFGFLFDRPAMLLGVIILIGVFFYTWVRNA